MILAAVSLVVLGVVVLVGTLFMASNSGWIAPTVLASTDPRVIELASTLQQETARRSELVLQKNELEMRLREARRWTEVEEAFQASFKTAIRSDLDARRLELKQLQALYAEREREKDAAVGRTPETAALEAKLGAVHQRIHLLETVQGGRAGTYDVLALRREYDRSLVAADQERDLAAALAKALAQTVEVLDQKTALIASLQTSPYARARSGDLVLAFVPYESLGQAKPGASIFACQTGVLFCHAVGTVGERLPGEVRGSHPIEGHEVRGQLVTLTLTAAAAANKPLLYAGRPPL